MQIAFIEITDPYEASEVWLNVTGIESIWVYDDGNTAVQMQSGRIHYAKDSRDDVFGKIQRVAEYFN